jgi:hypothetical protein
MIKLLNILKEIKVEPIGIGYPEGKLYMYEYKGGNKEIDEYIQPGYAIEAFEHNNNLMLPGPMLGVEGDEHFNKWLGFPKKYFDIITSWVETYDKQKPINIDGFDTTYPIKIIK